MHAVTLTKEWTVSEISAHHSKKVIKKEVGKLELKPYSARYNQSGAWWRSANDILYCFVNRNVRQNGPFIGFQHPMMF